MARGVASGDLSATSSPNGPLLGSELNRAIVLLTERQLQAYRYRREGYAWDWIATRMGVSRQAVMQRVVKAEKRLGYEPSVTPKGKEYKPGPARRRSNRVSAQQQYMQELLAQMPRSDADRLIRLIETAPSDEEAERRLLQRLAEIKRQRRRENAEEERARMKEMVRERDGRDHIGMSPFMPGYEADHQDDWSTEARSRSGVTQ